MELKLYQEQKLSYWLGQIATEAMREAYFGRVENSFKAVIDAAITTGLSFYQGTHQSTDALRFFFEVAPLSSRMDASVIYDVIDIIVHYEMHLYDVTSKVFLYLYGQDGPRTRNQIREAIELTARQVRDALATLFSKGMAYEQEKLIRPILTFKNWLYGYKHAGLLPEDHPHFQFQISTPAKRRRRVHYDLQQVCVKYFGAPNGILLSSAETNIMISCPFHSDTTPSMIVFPEGNWFCHSCHVKGDNILDLVAEAFFANDSMKELRAAEEIADLEDNALTLDPIEAREQQQRKAERYEAEVDAARRRYDHEYAAPQMYHPNWQFPSTYSHAQYEMLNLGFSGSILQKHHIYAWDLDKIYPIVIPLVSERGEVVGEQKMSTPSTRRRYRYAKKYFTTTGLDKSQHIYGLIRNDPVLMVVEGYKDLLMADQRGMHNVATTLGSDFSDVQAFIIAERYKYVICGYDNDAAGQRGFAQMKEKLEALGVQVVLLSIRSKDVHASAKEEFRHAVVAAFQELGLSTPLDVLKYGVR